MQKKFIMSMNKKVLDLIDHARIDMGGVSRNTLLNEVFLEWCVGRGLIKDDMVNSFKGENSRKGQVKALVKSLDNRTERSNTDEEDVAI